MGEADKVTAAERLASIEKRYKELQELTKLRKQRLLDSLSLYKLFTEADGVEQWINEKEKMLKTMVPGKDIEDCEIMKHRFDGFDREMNANASRVAVVNQVPATDSILFAFRVRQRKIKKIIRLPGGQINDPSWGGRLFSSIHPSNSLISVLYP